MSTIPSAKSYSDVGGALVVKNSMLKSMVEKNIHFSPCICGKTVIIMLNSIIKV